MSDSSSSLAGTPDPARGILAGFEHHPSSYEGYAIRVNDLESQIAALTAERDEARTENARLGKEVTDLRAVLRSWEKFSADAVAQIAKASGYDVWPPLPADGAQTPVSDPAHG